MCDFQDKKTPQ